MPEREVYTSDQQKKFLDIFESEAKACGYHPRTVKSISNCLRRMGIESPSDYISCFDEIKKRHVASSCFGIHEEIVTNMFYLFNNESFEL